MKSALLILLLFAAQTFADFSDDQFPVRSDVVARIVAAAEDHGFPLRSYRRRHTAWYLRSAEYIGALRAPFGTVHIARLVFTASSQEARTAQPLHFPFVVFLDRNFQYRTRWNVPRTLGRLSTEGTKLLLDHAVLFDYAHYARNDWVHIETGVQPIPQWR